MSARFAIVNGSTVENVVVATSTPTVPGRVVVGPLGAQQAVGPGDSYDGVNFTPRVPTSREQTRAAAPAVLQAAYPTLIQWAVDAQTLHDAATSAARGLTPAEEMEFLRRFGVFVRHFANWLAAAGLDS